MKKNLFMAALSFGALGFVSCSDDDNSNSENGSDDKLELFTSSNTGGSIGYTNLKATSPTARFFTIGSTDADGIYFDDDKNEVIVASRTNNRLEVYGNFRETLSGSATSFAMTASSTTGDFNNAREISVDGNRVVVVQDQNDANGLTNKLVVYQRTTTGFVLEKSFTIPFKLWGIDIKDGNLYAVEDLSNRLAVFNNIFSKSTGNLSPDKKVAIEGLIRTHGINYEDNTMVLTDVGSATSDIDGGIVVIENFSSVFSSTTNGGTISLTSQKRIYGPNSTLGNPVDVAFDDDNNKIYIAERLNAGGRVLSFAYPTAAQSDATPLTARSEPGVTGVYLRD